MANRANFAHPWVNNILSEAPPETLFNQFGSENIMSSSSSITPLQLSTNNELQHFSAPPLNNIIPTYKPSSSSLFSNHHSPSSPSSTPSPELPSCSNFMAPSSSSSLSQAASVLFDVTPPTLFSPLNNTATSDHFEQSQHMEDDDEVVGLGNIRAMGFPFSLASEPWKQSSFSWDSPTY
nr:putative NAC domain-containing protein 94 [Ipomoea trifida]